MLPLYSFVLFWLTRFQTLQIPMFYFPMSIWWKYTFFTIRFNACLFEFGFYFVNKFLKCVWSEIFLFRLKFIWMSLHIFMSHHTTLSVLRCFYSNGKYSIKYNSTVLLCVCSLFSSPSLLLSLHSLLLLTYQKREAKWKMPFNSESGKNSVFLSNSK